MSSHPYPESSPAAGLLLLLLLFLFSHDRLLLFWHWDGRLGHGLSRIDRRGWRGGVEERLRLWGGGGFLGGLGGHGEAGGEQEGEDERLQGVTGDTAEASGSFKGFVRA